MNYLMGIDIGTSGTKTIVINENGQLKASAFVEHKLDCPKPGWAQQNPQEWWNAAVESIKQVLKNGHLKGSDIKGIGLSGQMHGLVLIDDKFNILMPAILWCDQRTAKECEEINEKIGIDKLNEYTCNPALTGFTAPKILWVRKHLPKIYKKIYKILLPKDYIRFKLTGVFASEVSDASGTLLFDVKNRKWSKEMLNALDIDKNKLPKVYESPVISGYITSAIAKETGLLEKTPVVGGGGDQAAGAIGNGIVKPGIISVTIGTSGVVFAHTDKIKMDKLQRVHSFCHAVPEKWHIMGVMLSAGGSFQWFKNNLGNNLKYDILTKEAQKIPVGSEGLIFLPYLMGERTPHKDPYAKGVFFGITMRHTKAHFTRSILEGVTYGLRDSLEIIRGMNLKIKQIRASGGGAKSKFWRQIQADVFNSEIVTINISEGPAFGVALLAGVGVKIYKSVEEACEKTIRITSHTYPIKNNVQKYEEYYKLYNSLYPALKDKFSSRL